MKKYLILISILVVIVFFILTGRSRTDVYLKEYEVSNDGKNITLKVGVSGSSGYIRTMK